MGVAIGRLRDYANKHKGQTAVVVGTGPSMIQRGWPTGPRAFGTKDEVQKILRKCLVFGINRSFSYAPINYQVSLDNIAGVLLRKGPPEQSWKRLNRVYNEWVARYGRRSTLEEFAFTNKHKLTWVNGEIWHYLRLASPTRTLCKVLPCGAPKTRPVQRRPIYR
jgi:hypothetical protein